MHNSLTLSLKFYFEKKNELIYAIYTFKNIRFDKQKSEMRSFKLLCSVINAMKKKKKKKKIES